MNTFKNSQMLFPDLFKPPGKANPKPPPRRSRLVFGTPRRPGNVLVFLVSFMTYLLGIFPSMLYALPSDPTVQAGSVDIHEHSPGSMVIHQSTDKAIIDWRAFGIGSDEQVDFQLPTSSGVTLNRVTGNERSDIMGSLTSNGNLYLINPNGVLFGANSRVDVHGLVATTSNISNENFLSGNYNFNIPSNRGGIIVNRGRITIAQGGLVALVAPGVQNAGIIEARLGRVTLASGNTFTLDLYGDQLINLGLNSKITQQVTGLNGEILSSLVSNSGKIYADGGRVRLDVNAARDVVDQVINMSGIIEAKTAVEQNGSIVLMGGDEGAVDVSGTLDASGLNEGETGGTIHVFGESIGLFGSALLDASGHSGGGEILVGGDYQGQGAFPTASEVFVDRGVSIFNDALWSGDGGRSIFWADRRMRFFGSVFARGGRKKGNGGFIEVSGKEELFFDGWADTSAANGLMGTLLLDPTDIVIANGSGNSASGATTFTIFEQTLEALSGNTNIDLLATNSITMNDLTDGLLNLNISGSLTLVATNGAITFLDTNDKIKSSGGINLTAGGNLTLGSLESTDGNITLKGNDLILSGTINSANGTTTLLSSNGGTIGLGATGGTFSISGAELQSITAKNLVIGDGSNGSITVDGITAGNSNNIVETVTLNATKSTSKVTFANNGSTFNALTANAGNGIAANAAVTTDTGNLTFDGDSDNSGGGDIALANGIALTTVGNLVLNSGVTTSGDANLNGGTGVTLANGVNIASGGALTLGTTSGSINAQGAVTVTAASGITLNDDFTSAGSTVFNAGTGSFTVASGKTVTTGNNSLSITGGDIVLTGSLNSGTGTTTLLSSNGGTIGLGAGAGSFSVSDSELDRITASNLTIGDATNGDITVDGVTNSNNAVTLNATKSTSKVTFANNASTFNGLTVNAGNGVTISENLTTQSSASFNADSNDDGSGSFTVATSKTVSTGNNALSIKGNDIVLTGSLNSGTGTTTLLASNGGTIGLGAGAGTFSVSGGELQNITAGNLVVGDATNGDVTVAGVTAANTGTIAGTTTLNATKSTSNVTFTTASSFGGPLSLNAGANATVLTDNALTLASSTIGGTLTVSVGGAGNGLIVGGNQTVGGTISLLAASDITLTGGLASSSASASAVTLTSTNGGIFDGDANGALDIDAASGGLVVNSVTGFGTPSNAIETKVLSVNINNTGAGAINIFETDSLNVVNINHVGPGDINVTYFGTLTGEANANAADGTATFTNRDSGSLFLPQFGKTLSEVTIQRTVNITTGLESGYFFGNRPPPTQGNSVAQMLSGPETGPFVTNVFDENFELIRVAKGTRRAHSGLKGFSNFWGPLGLPNTELVKRPSRKSGREEAKLKKKRGQKRKAGVKRKARPRLKNARVKAVGDTASLPIVQKQRQKQKRSKKPTQSWLASQLGNFFK